MEDRKRHTNEETLCRLCGLENENIEHFILNCNNPMKERNKTVTLQRHHVENNLQIMLTFYLVTMIGKRTEKKEKSLYFLWKSRKQMLEGR